MTEYGVYKFGQFGSYYLGISKIYFYNHLKWHTEFMGQSSAKYSNRHNILAKAFYSDLITELFK